MTHDLFEPMVGGSAHTCHHPRCELEVPPRLLACRAHWFQLPRHLRQAIWDAYRPGQEVDKEPSDAYLEAAHACHQYWLGAS